MLPHREVRAFIGAQPTLHAQGIPAHPAIELETSTDRRPNRPYRAGFAFDFDHLGQVLWPSRVVPIVGLPWQQQKTVAVVPRRAYGAAGAISSHALMQEELLLPVVQLVADDPVLGEFGQ